MDTDKMKLKIDRLKEQIKFLDEQVLKIIEKADAAEGDIKDNYNKRINELQDKIVEKKKEISKIESMIKDKIV